MSVYIYIKENLVLPPPQIIQESTSHTRWGKPGAAAVFRAKHAPRCARTSPATHSRQGLGARGPDPADPVFVEN